MKIQRLSIVESTDAISLTGAICHMNSWANVSNEIINKVKGNRVVYDISSNHPHHRMGVK